MKIAMIVFLFVHMLDLFVLPIFTAKCRYGLKMDKCEAWIPFHSLYKVFLIVELCLVAGLGKSEMFWFLAAMDFFCWVEWTAFCSFVVGHGGYSVRDPWTRTKDDILNLAEQRFYPIHPFNLDFYMAGLEVNMYRYMADAVAIITIAEILCFL